jgi:hypothetical protein
MIKAELKVGINAQNPGKRLLSVIINILTKIEIRAKIDKALFISLFCIVTLR